MSNRLLDPSVTNQLLLMSYNNRENTIGIFGWINNHRILTILIICIIFYIYLYYQSHKENFIYDYHNVTYSDHKNNNHNEKKYYKYNTILDKSNTRKFIRPTFNPHYPVAIQNSYVRYLPNEHVYQTPDGKLKDHSNKLIKNGSVVTDEGIQNISYIQLPDSGIQFKGPEYTTPVENINSKNPDYEEFVHNESVYNHGKHKNLNYKYHLNHNKSSERMIKIPIKKSPQEMHQQLKQSSTKTINVPIKIIKNSNKK